MNDTGGLRVVVQLPARMVSIQERYLSQLKPQVELVNELVRTSGDDFKYLGSVSSGALSGISEEQGSITFHFGDEASLKKYLEANDWSHLLYSQKALKKNNPVAGSGVLGGLCSWRPQPYKTLHMRHIKKGCFDVPNRYKPL